MKSWICLPISKFTFAPVFSTYVTGFFTLLARYFSRCASRSISMRLWTEFAKGSNFRNLALFGSGYAGLGSELRKFRSSGRESAHSGYRLKLACSARCVRIPSMLNTRDRVTRKMQTISSAYGVTCSATGNLTENRDFC